jgi:hypothetical protein
MRTRIVAGFLVIAMLSWVGSRAATPAQFTPPADGKLTDKQVIDYIAVIKDQMAITAKSGKRMNDVIAEHGLTRAEYDWIAKEFGNCWPGAIYQQQWEQSAKADLEKQIKLRQEHLAAAKAQLAAAEQANNDRPHPRGKDRGDASAAPEKSDADSIADEIKIDQEAIKPIQDEIAQHEKDAAGAEALAKNPPAGISADERPAYIDQKKNDAQTEHDAARDARDRLAEVQKSLDDANARLNAFTRKTTNTEAVIGDKDQSIADAKTAISIDERIIQSLQNVINGGPINLADDNDKQKVDLDNLALVKKHLTEYLQAMGAADGPSK